jgi:hypothetical protein
MFCKKCGTEMKDGAMFCPSCGEAARRPGAEIVSPAKAEKKGLFRAKISLLWLIGGFLVGIPVSYPFQDEFIREKIPFEKYIFNIPDMWRLGNSPDPGYQRMAHEIFAVMLVTCVVSAIVFGVIGVLVTAAKNKGD